MSWGARVIVAVYEVCVIYTANVCQLWSQVCFRLKRLSNICSGCFESKIEKLSKLSEKPGVILKNGITQTTLIKITGDH